MTSCPDRGARPAEVPAVTVVVVTHNSGDVIAGCLHALPAALRGVPHEVVVVDNDSHDDTLAVAAEALPAAVLLPLHSNTGYAAAINAGVEALGPRDAVLVLNPDVRLDPGSVLACTRHLGDGVGIVVPALVDEVGHRQLSQRREPTVGRAWAEAVLGGDRAARVGLGEMVADGPSYERETSVDWATGAAMLVSAACLADVGPMDESFFLYSEETDFMLRAGDAGWQTRYVPDARAVHLGGDLARSPWLWSLSARNRVRLHRRRHSRLSTMMFLLASLVGESVRALAGRATSRAAVRELARVGPAIVWGAPPPVTPAHLAPPGWICFSAHDWWYFSHAHSDFQLMQRIAARRPVLLVNSIGLRLPMPGRTSAPASRLVRKAASLRRYVRTPVRDNPDFHVMTPVPLPLYGSERLRRLGTWLVRVQVELAARRLGVIAPDRLDPVVSITLPTAIGASKALPHSALVVYRSDKHSSFAEADSDAIALLEEECITEADLVFFSSRALRHDEAAWAGDRARDLDHGVDPDLFSPSDDPLPADLQAIAGPRVGFFGAVRDHLVDIELLEEVARRIPEAQLVIVGQILCAPERVATLRAMPNVHLLGARHHEDVPAYGRGFDVALMPWNVNEWMRYANPIKMKEYLALGLPVVSTDFPEVHRYGHLIRVTGTIDEFVDAVRTTLDDGGPATPSERRAAVVGSTWDAAAAHLLEETEAVMRRSSPDLAHPGS